MKKPVKLNFGERMREWRKAKKAYADEVKKKVSEKQEIEDRYPKLDVPTETKTLNLSPTQQTEMKADNRPVSAPANHIEAAIQRLREKAKGI